MVETIFLYHKRNTACDKLANFFENIKVLYFFVLSLLIYYFFFIFRDFFTKLFNFFVLHYNIIIIIVYIMFFIISFFIFLKSANFFRNSFILFFIYKNISKETNINYISFYFLLITITYYLNSLMLKIFLNPRTMKDIFINELKSVEKIVYIFLYLLVDSLIFYFHYFLAANTKEYFGECIELDYTIGALFFCLLYLGGIYYNNYIKSKRFEFKTVLQRFIFIGFINITGGLYFFKLFNKIEQKDYMNTNYLFLIFLFATFFCGFSIECILKKLEIYQHIKKAFNLYLYAFIFVFYCPFVDKKDVLLFICAGVIIVKFYINYALKKISKNLVYKYISDSLIFMYFFYEFYQDSEYKLFIAVLTLSIYIVTTIIEFLIVRVNLFIYCLANTCNFLLLLCLCQKIKAEKEAEIRKKYIAEKNVLKEKSLRKIQTEDEIREKQDDEDKPLSTLNSNNYSINFSDMVIMANMYDMSEGDIKCDEDCCLVKMQRSINECVDELNKSKRRIYYYPNPLVPNSCTKSYDVYKIYEITNQYYLLKIVEYDLKQNYKKSLIDDEKYREEWDDNICRKYLSKFNLFSLGSMGEKEPYNNMVTIFISGFLTEDNNSFAKYFKEYSFNNNKKSDYYFYLWPSYGALDFNTNICESISKSMIWLNGIGCKFEEAYNNALIAGNILAFIIQSKKFFGEAKINLVGHSLGCRVIYKCLNCLKDNYENMEKIINDVILLAGATTMNDIEFNQIVEDYVNGRFIHCFNPNDTALFISQPFSTAPIGIREIYSRNKIENYETDLEHTNYCNNLDFILKEVTKKSKISFI